MTCWGRRALGCLARLTVLLGVLTATVACTVSPEPQTTPNFLPSEQSQPPAADTSEACSAGSVKVRANDYPQTVLENAGAWASLCFMPGTYRLDQGLHPLPGQTLVFRAGAVLNGSEIVTNWTRQGSHWFSTDHSHSDLDNVPGLPDPAQMCQVTQSACIYEDVFFDGRPLHHVQTLSALDEPQEVFFDKPIGTIYLSTDPTNRLVEMTVSGFGISSPTTDVVTDDVIIRGATIEHFAYVGIYTEADGWTIEDSEIRYNHGGGIGIFGGTGHVIRNSRVHHNGMIGMTAQHVDDFTIEGNELDHNNYLYAGPRTGGYHEGSVKILESNEVVFRNNWSHDNVGDGLWFDWDNYDVLIENNVLEGNTRNGLHYEASFDATVRFNTIRNNGTWESQSAGILNSTSKNIEYYGNRIEHNLIRPIVILWGDRGFNAMLGERQSANLYFHDNVIILDDSDQSWVGASLDQDPRVFDSNNRFQGNTYHATARGENWWRWDSGSLTWTQWQTRGFDTAGSYLPP